MLWLDHYYKYKRTLTINNWIPQNTKWFEDRNSWNDFMTGKKLEIF
jgi:hypothetical protein